MVIDYGDVHVQDVYNSFGNKKIGTIISFIERQSSLSAIFPARILVIFEVIWIIILLYGKYIFVYYVYYVWDFGFQYWLCYIYWSWLLIQQVYSSLWVVNLIHNKDIIK